MDIEIFVENFKVLPEQAQREVVDFMAFLKSRYLKPPAGTNSGKSFFFDEPFLGMWKDRADLAESTDWVRNMRKKEWDKNE